VDDGSADRSGAIAEEFAAAHPNQIRVIHTPNGGLGHARNTGLEAAEGKYLLFLDSDDTLARGALREILDSLDDSFDVGLFDFITVNESGHQLEYTSGCERQGRFTLEEHPQLLFAPPNAVNKLWRRRLFTESGIRFPDRQWFEDLATVPRLYLQAESFAVLRKPWYVYLQRSGSIMTSDKALRNREIITAVDTVLEAYRDTGLYERYEAELCRMALYHQLLTSCDRVALIDPKSPVLPELVEDFERKFPYWRKNRYVRQMSQKHKLLLELIIRRRFREVKALMEANNHLRRKER
jgi:glycosyltransferase involved in cell wall biosynthesis